MHALFILLSQSLAEIEVESASPAKPGCEFKKSDEGYEFYLNAEKIRAVLPQVKSFGAMTAPEAHELAWKIIDRNFELRRGQFKLFKSEEETVEDGAGKKTRMGWFMEFRQLHQGAEIYASESPAPAPGGRILVFFSDDMADVAAARATSLKIRLQTWRIVREHGAAVRIMAEDRARQAVLKDYAAKYPKTKAAEAELVLAYVPKAGAKDRRLPAWHATVQAAGEGPFAKPVIHEYVVDASTGKFIFSERVHIPGAEAPVPAPPER